MKDRFTAEALAAWESLDASAQELITQNCWCSRCSEPVAMRAFCGHPKDEDLVLEGKCANCDGEVARLALAAQPRDRYEAQLYPTD